MFMVIGTTYYDDYPTVEPEQTAASARTCQELLLTSLGWKFAKEGKKALEFASSFDVLGKPGFVLLQPWQLCTK